MLPGIGATSVVHVGTPVIPPNIAVTEGYTSLQ